MVNTPTTGNTGDDQAGAQQAPANPGSQIPPTPAPVVQPSGPWQNAREVIAALISLAIVLVALYMLVDTYNSGRANMGGGDTAQAALAAYNRQRDVLLFALGLLGTVTGYYLGRVPAELRANSAEQSASTARQSADAANQAAAAANRNTDSVKQETDAMLGQVDERLAQLQDRAQPARATLSDPPAAAEASRDLQDMRQDIERLRRRLRS